nr:hypothetical protein [Candidatus Sigynarchaeota archaeon]
MRSKVVYEAICSVYSPIDGMPHFTPIGVREMPNDYSNDARFLEARIFCTAKLFAYLFKKKDCVVHFPSIGQQSFYLFAFKNEMSEVLESLVLASGISKARLVDAPVLDALPNRVEARVQDVTFERIDDAIARVDIRNSKRAIFTLRCMRPTFEHPLARALKRPCGLFMDFLVTASRLRMIPGNNPIFDVVLKSLNDNIKHLQASPDTEKEASLAVLLFQRLMGDKSGPKRSN